MGVPKKKSKCTFEDGDQPWRCRARAKQRSAEAGEPVRCGQPKVEGYEVCRYHGARGGRPIVHGRYSTKLGRLREAFEAAVEDEQGLMDLRQTMALLDVAVQQAAERLGDKDTPDFRARAITLFERARDATDPDEARRFLTELGALLKRGGDEDRALERLSVAAERLATRQEKAWGIKLSAAQAVNARDLMLIMSRIVDVVVEEAPENATRIIERLDSEIVGSSEIRSRLEAGE